MCEHKYDLNVLLNDSIIFLHVKILCELKRSY